VCHGGTTSADLTHGEPLHQPQHNRPVFDRNASGASSFGLMENFASNGMGAMGSPNSGDGSGSSGAEHYEDGRSLFSHHPRSSMGMAGPGLAMPGPRRQNSDELGWGAGLSGSTLGDNGADTAGGGDGYTTARFGQATSLSSSSSSTGAGAGSHARGPIFSNIFLAHHLHNAPADVQDVLLQALRIKQISVDGLPVNLPAIHLCVATHSRTVVSPAAPGITPRLLDEFVMDIQADAGFFSSLSAFLLSPPLPAPTLAALVPIPWAAVRQLVNEDESSRGIFLSGKMGQYARDLSVALRSHGRVAMGPSPQGMAAMVHAAKCHAFFAGAGFVRPVDIDSVAESALCHRLLLRSGGVVSSSGGGGMGGGPVGGGVVLAAGGTGPSATTAQSRALIAHMINKVLLPPK